MADTTAPPTRNCTELSEDARALFTIRGIVEQHDMPELFANMDLQRRCCLRQDKKTTSDRDLDIRDKWLGLHFLRKGYTPQTFRRNGAHVPLHDRAKVSATQLATEQWGLPANLSFDYSATSVHNVGVFCLVWEIRTCEVRAAIHRWKTGTAGGTDEKGVAWFKAQDSHGIQLVTSLVGRRRSSAGGTASSSSAQLQKGEHESPANRPIASLNTCCNIFACIVQRRLAHGLDQLLHPTQFGFRQRRGNKHGIYIISRLVGASREDGHKTIVGFIRLGSTFDKITCPGLFSRLCRMRVPAKLYSVIEALYDNPRFEVEIDGASSQW
jgi:hypothetical protein